MLLKSFMKSVLSLKLDKLTYLGKAFQLIQSDPHKIALPANQCVCN